MKKAISYLLILTLTFTMLFSGVSFSFAAETPRESDSVAGEAYVEDEVLVVFEDEISQKKAETIVEDADVAAEDVEEIAAPVSEETPEATPYVVTLDEKETSVEDAVEELDKDSDVAYAQPNYLYTLNEGDVKSAAANDTLRDKQWNLDYMNVEAAWEYINERKTDGKIDGDKVVVATLDTGISPEHKDLKNLNSNIDWDHCVTVAGQPGPDYPRYESADALPDGHGTGVAGVLAATSNNNEGIAGVAAGTNNDLIQLMGINVFQNYSGGQSAATTADIIKGLEYACDNGAQVINMALGHTWGEKDGKGGTHDDDALQSAINDAVDKGAVIIATAGNTKDQSGWYPSDFDNVISVINTVEYDDAWSKDCKAAGSSYGSKKDLSAPGSSVWRTVLPEDDSASSPDGYDPGSGTSLSAPAVSGVAAMVLYVNPDLSSTPSQTANKVRDILCGTTTDLYSEGYDIYTGYGNVDAYAAVKAAGDVADGAVLPDPDRNRDDELMREEAQLETPSNVTAKDSGMEAITIKWNKVPNATRYSILRSETGTAGTYKKIATTTSGSSTSYVDNSCEYNKTYYYIVRAFGTSAVTHKKTHSEDSAAVSAKSTTPSKLSTPVVNVQGTAYNTIKISWKRIANAEEYQIYRSRTKTGGYSRLKRITKGSTTSYNDSSCSFNTTYYYKIIAHGTSANGKDMRSAASVPVSAKTVLPAPSFSVTSADYRTHKISWNKVSGASGYRIFRATSKNGSYKNIKTTTKSSTTSWNSSGLTAGKTYYYKIRPYRTVSGKRVYGTLSQSKYRKARPKKPTFRIKKSGRRVTLTLQKNSKLNGYVIYRQRGNGKWKKVKTVTVNGRRGAKYTCKLSRGKTYSFKVKSYKKVGGKRIYSLESSVKKKKI